MNNYHFPIQVVAADIDEMGHVNNARYVNWMQDAATAHWVNITSAQQRSNYLWVVRRHQIDYLRPALMGDALVCQTWVDNCRGALCTRHYRITRGEELLLRAYSQWCMIGNINKQARPMRIPKDIVALFAKAP
ncbi:MAG: acyl-ACP thioesterase [Gammaproteobacteria bacterium]|nr:MAG: acyl-ACP thioesterase [Gammaproteobacteria bacterium]